MSAPAWVLALLAQVQREKLTGFLTVSLRHGDIRHVKVEQVHFAPHDPAAVLCPRGCGPMEKRDGGTLWVCECGAKRTAAQVAQASGR